MEEKFTYLELRKGHWRLDVYPWILVWAAFVYFYMVPTKPNPTSPHLSPTSLTKSTLV